MEALKIQLTGSAAANYDIYYRTHVQNLGWLDWAKNGAASGSAGYAYLSLIHIFPTIIGELLEEQKVEVKVLKSHDKWFGVTYKEDKEAVVEAIRSLVANGVYPEKLFG